MLKTKQWPLGSIHSQQHTSVLKLWDGLYICVFFPYKKTGPFVELRHPSRGFSSEGTTWAKPWSFSPCLPRRVSTATIRLHLVQLLYSLIFSLSRLALAARQPALRGQCADLVLLHICFCKESSIEDGFQFPYKKALSPTARLYVYSNQSGHALAAPERNSSQILLAWSHTISTSIPLHP